MDSDTTYDASAVHSKYPIQKNLFNFIRQCLPVAPMTINVTPAMNKILPTIAFILVFVFVIQAQDFRKPDASPMDMAYFPDNFAHDRKEGDKAVIRVTYSRPLKKERVIFGKLVPYGEVWRCGANEASEIKFYQDVNLNGKKVEAGTYSLFVIPEEKEWTIILNSDLDYWGAYKYNAQHDVIRVPAIVSQMNKSLESFTIQFADKGEKQGVMKLGWDKTVAEVPFNF